MKSMRLSSSPDKPVLSPGNAGLLPIILLALVVVTEWSPAAIFARIDDIPGESQSADHKDWIDILSVGASTGPTVGTTARVMQRGDLVVRKRIDKSSPYLVGAALRQTKIPNVLIEVEEEGQIEICYRLKGVRLVRHDLETLPNGGGPVERYHLRFDVGEWHDFQSAPRGRSHVGTTWNFLTNEGGTLDSHLDNGPRIAPVKPIEIAPGKATEVRIDLLDPANRPDQLEFAAFAPEGGLVKILGIAGKGSQRTLSLEAGTLENGIEEITLSVTDGTRSSTRALPILIAGRRTPYETYLRAYLGNQAATDPDILRPLRDPDGDELTNLMEFFLGTNPASPTSRQEAFTMIRDQNENGTAVRIQYFRRTDQDGLSEQFEGTFDLNKWESLGPRSQPPVQVKQLEAPANGYAPMEATIPLGLDAGSFFLRLSVRGSL